jgi:hypothetical protein
MLKLVVAATCLAAATMLLAVLALTHRRRT